MKHVSDECTKKINKLRKIKRLRKYYKIIKFVYTNENEWMTE
jgi:hypothetical protein